MHSRISILRYISNLNDERCGCPPKVLVLLIYYYPSFSSSPQMLVTTPAKWDVISRKGLGDASLVQALKLLIIDEIHLLHEDRGAVIEALVARTLRQVRGILIM